MWGGYISRPLPFFLVWLCFPRKLRKPLPISQSASPIAGATGSEKISQKFPKESVVCLSLFPPRVPLIHTTFCACLAPGTCSARDWIRTSDLKRKDRQLEVWVNPDSSATVERAFAMPRRVKYRYGKTWTNKSLSMLLCYKPTKQAHIRFQ